MKSEILEILKNNFTNIYENQVDEINYQIERYKRLLENFENIFGEEKNISIISTPGRTELSGNHTDHNGGKVIAASISLDTVIAFAKSENIISIKSDKYDEIFKVDLNNLSPHENEIGTTNSLIRGIAAQFVIRGFKIGGFNSVLTSNVLQGSGLSSSASVEVTIGSVLNFLYNNNEIPDFVIAQIGQFAENKFFGKPCGLMDQTACAVGGIIKIDFVDNKNPVIHKVNFKLEDFGYKLIVVDTGGTHQNLTDDYSAIPNEMKEVANFFNKEKCSEISLNQFLENINELRKSINDRSILRAFHFLTENIRVDEQIKSLENNDLNQFLNLVKQSGSSSYKFLQNIYSNKNVEEQPISLALAITENFLEEIGEGACRVHGGGFAGTIQVFLPQKNVKDYQKIMEKIFGENSVNIISIRQFGSVLML
ncbi:MAG: galactokinase [Ignavibacteriae bacterium]|nr:galactokinase [Ignavibacteriota bacterium]